MSQILIAHRGNINGRIESMENKPEYIDSAIEKGYDVEIDLWAQDGRLYLGHDAPTYEIEPGYLVYLVAHLWVHCKNIAALNYLINYSEANLCHLNYFFHHKDDATLTSHNYIWTYPDSKLLLTNKSIAVMPEYTRNWNTQICYGVCSDYVSDLSKIVGKVDRKEKYR